MSAQTRTEIVDLLDRHGVRPVQRLGQHFLADPNLTRRIVSVAGVGPGDRVIEIGAGTGTLTMALAAAGAHVTAFEVDRRLQPLLRQVTEGLDVDLVIADATTVDLGARFPDGPLTLVANLPYNVGTGLVMDALRHAPAIVRMVVMVQREVAGRLVARPGDPDYGLPSVVVAIHGRARALFRVPPQVFVPAPRVESAVVAIDRHPAPDRAEEAIALARAAFSHRRKMLRTSLASVMEDPVGRLEAVGIDPTRRAESLGAEDWLRLAEVGR